MHLCYYSGTRTLSRSFSTYQWNFLLRCMCIMAWMIFACGSKAAGQSELNEILQSRVQNIQKYGWRFEGGTSKREPIDWISTPNVDDPLEKRHKDGLGTFKIVENLATQGQAVVDSNTGFHKIDYSVGGRKRGSFANGNLFARFSSTKMGEKDGPMRAEIGGQKSPGNLDLLDHIYSGYHYLPFRIPQLRRCFNSEELSISTMDFIEILNDESAEKRVVRQDDRFHVIFQAFGKGEANGEQKIPQGEIIYEFANDGALELILWRAGELWSPTITVSVANQSRLLGMRVPSSVTETDWELGISKRVNYMDWFVPVDEDFKLVVPPDSFVVDHVNKLTYVNSGNARNEAASARTYAIDHDLKLSNPSSTLSFKNYLFLVLFILTVFVVIIRKWRFTRFFVAFVFLPSIVGCERPSYSLVENSIRYNDERLPPDQKVNWYEGIGWKVQLLEDNAFYISQCGLKTSFLALELAERKYDPFLVSRMLQPTDEGIRMSDIRSALLAHGIDVAARKSISFSQVIDASSKFDFSIIHIPQYQKWGYTEAHYAIVFRDSSQGVLFLDVPRPPVRLDHNLSKDINAINDLTVLFCSKKKTNRDPNWELEETLIKIKPEDFKEGVYRGKVTLVNNGDQPIAIVDGKISCACVKMDFTPEVILPKESASFEFSIDRANWGRGTQSISFCDAVGDIKAVSLEGMSAEVSDKENRDEILKRPFVIRQTLLLPQDIGRSEVDRKFSVTVPERIPSGCLASPREDNCVASLQYFDSQCRLEGSILLKRSEIESFSNGNVVSCIVDIRKDNDVIGTAKFYFERVFKLDYKFTRIERRLVLEGDFQGCEGWQLKECEIDDYRLLSIDKVDDFRWRAVFESRISTNSPPLFAKASFSNPDHHGVTRILVVRE
jgi:hypothetical protein